MATEIDPLDLVTLKRLETGLAVDQADIAKCDNYYEGKQPLNYMAPALKDEIGDTVTEVVINWARIVADAYENRLDIEGFRYPGAESGDDDLWAVWQANNMDEQSQQGHLDSLALRRSYVIVGPGEGDAPPLVTVESPTQVWAERDPRTRKVVAAIKKWTEVDKTQRAALFTPDYSIEYAQEQGRWFETWKDSHQLGVCPVVVQANRPRLLLPDGVSELADIMPIADAANKMATDMMVSGEYHAIPRRWATGVSQADFQDPDGNPISTWQRLVGRIWGAANEKANFGTFHETDLVVFHSTIKVLAQIVSQLAALPPHYMSFTGDNPASADAIRSSETQLVKRVERKQTFLGGGWEDVQRLVLRFQTGVFDPKATALETVWRDPSTPTEAQKADAVVKKVQAGIIPIAQAREDLGYSPEQIQRMADQDVAADPLTRIARPLTESGAPAVGG